MPSKELPARDKLDCEPGTTVETAKKTMALALKELCNVLVIISHPSTGYKHGAAEYKAW